MKPSIPTPTIGHLQTRMIRKPSSPPLFLAVLQLASRNKRAAKLFGFFAAMLMTLQSVMASYTVTLEGSGAYNPVGIHLDNPAGNDLNTLFPGASDNDMILLWDCVTQDFDAIVPTYTAGMGQWIPNLTLTPGQGVFYVNVGPTRTATLNGNPVMPVYPPAQYCGCDKKSMLANQSATVGTWGSLISTPPINGSQFITFNVMFFDWVTNKFENCAWTLGEPQAAIGEAVWIVVPCTNSAPCNPCTNNLVINGSFEITSPAVLPNTPVNDLDPITGVPGWTTTIENTLEVWGNTYNGLPASEGTNHMEINAQSNDMTVSQVVTNLSTNCPVTICFDYTGRFGLSGATYNNDFTFSLSGGFTYSVDLNPPTYSGSWTNYCVTFMPTSSIVTISFRGHPHYVNGVQTQGGAHLDNVTLTQCCSNNPCTNPVTVTCSTNKSINCGTTWNFDAPIITEVGGGTNYTVTFTTTTNGLCPYAEYTRNWTITDACGNTNYCSQTVTVINPVPLLNCASNKTVQCGVAWSFDPPTVVNGSCDTTTTVLNTFTNGNCPMNITRMWLVANPCGFSNFCSQTVTIMDTVPPVFNCPTNKTVQCGTSWQFDTATATDNCGGVITPSILATFTNGTCTKIATRIWQAVDACGNSTTCTQLVTVADTIAPVLCCPNDMTFTTCSNSVVVNFKVKVTDNCSTGLIPVSTPSSGSSFPVGTTIVTNTATDACGNVGTCTFKVTVKAGVTTTKTLTIGNVDCFSTANKDYTPRSVDLNSLGGLTTFDANPFPGSFGASFLGLPTSISCARLEIQMRPYTGNTNTAFYDKIALGLTNTSGGGQFAWTNNIGNQGSGGGLIPTSWDFGVPACGRTFYINLQSLIPLMSSSHKLDILVRSNTFVDYARLCYCYCASKPVWKGFELDLSNMTLYRACDDIIIVKRTGPGTATFGSAVGQTASVSFGFEPISFVSAVDGLTFRGQRVSGASPNLATVSGDGAGGMEFHSTAVRSNVTQIEVTLYNGNNAVSQSTLTWSPTALIANTAAGAKLVRASVSENGDKQTFKLEAPVLMSISTNAPAVADSIAIKFVGAQDVAGDMIEGYFFDTEMAAEIAMNDVSVQTGTLETRVTGDAITAVSGDTTTVTSTEQSTNSVTGLTLPVPNKPILIGPVLDGCNGWIIDRWLDVKLANIGNVKFTGVSNVWDVGCTFPVFNPTNGVRYQVLNGGTVVADSGVIPVTAANVSELPSRWSFSTNTAQGIVQMNWAETALFTINGNSTAGDELRLIPLGSNLPAPVFNTMTIESVGIEAIAVSAQSAAGPWTLLPLELNGNSVTIQWTGPTGGILESAPTVLGPWTTVSNQVEFLTIKPRTTAPAEFFRVRSN